MPRVPWHPQILADQLTLSQSEGANYAHQITTGTPGFSDLPTVLRKTTKFNRFLLFHNSRVTNLAQILVDLCLKHDFDGLTLEVWNQLGGQARPELRRVISELAENIKKADKLIIVVIPPPLHHNDVKGMIEEEDFDRMSDSVDYFR